MVHKVLLIVATANSKYNQMQLLRADRWPTILLCKVQVFQHFEKITYNKVLKLGKPVSINTAVKLSKRLKPKKRFYTLIVTRSEPLLYILHRAASYRDMQKVQTLFIHEFNSQKKLQTVKNGKK